MGFFFHIQMKGQIYYEGNTLAPMLKNRFYLRSRKKLEQGFQDGWFKVGIQVISWNAVYWKELRSLSRCSQARLELTDSSSACLHNIKHVLFF